MMDEQNFKIVDSGKFANVPNQSKKYCALLNAVNDGKVVSVPLAGLNSRTLRSRLYNAASYLGMRITTRIDGDAMLVKLK